MKKPKIHSILFLIFLLGNYFASAQTIPVVCGTGVEVEMNSTCNNQPGEFVARDRIVFKQDYQFNSNNGTMRARLDEHLLFDAQYVDQNDPNNYELDFNLTVGTTTGIFNVSNTGGALYNVPIYCAPGTNGMQPNVSIAYNSQAGNGLLGWGWDLVGLSTITRSGKSFIHDGKRTGYEFDNNNAKFMLDGNRLQWDANENAYRTEIESFSLITKFGGSNGNPEWFEVKTKNGMTIQYGKENNSKFPSTGNHLVWYINKIIDPSGNYISFHYEELMGNLYIKKIDYTGNETIGMQPYNSIVFFYEIRQDKNIKYVNGITIDNSVLLRKIKSMSEGKLVREYQFKYFSNNPNHFNSNNNYSFLNEIIELNEYNEQFNSLKFSYGEKSYTNPSDIEIPNNLPIIQNSDYISGDFNGNGRNDLILFTKNNNIYTGYKYFLNSDGQYGEIISNGVLPINFYPMDYNNPVLGKNYFIEKNGTYNIQRNTEINHGNRDMHISSGVICTDINGDGKEDLLFATLNVNLITYKAYQFDENANSFVNFNNFTCNYEHLFTMGDFDGSGQTDLFMYNKENGIWMVYANNNSNPITGNKYFNLQNQLVFSLDGMYFFPVDYNGNGKTELAAIKDNKVIILNFIFLSQNNIELRQIAEFNTPTPLDIMFGDFNGDGISDLLVKHIKTGNQTEWSVIYGSGTNSLQNPLITMNDLYASHVGSPEIIKYLVGDFNGDGLSDIVQFRKISNDWLATVLYSNGFAGFIKKTYSYSWANLLMNEQTRVIAGDFDGNGTLDVFISDGNSHKTITFANSKEQFFLQTIYDGMGNFTEISYKPISRQAVYEKDNTLSYDFPIISNSTPSLYVVAETITSDGVGGENKTSFKYKGASVHVQGRGFLGFSETISSNENKNRKITNIYSINDTQPYYCLTDLAETKVTTYDEIVLSHTSNTYTYHLFTNTNSVNKRLFRYPSVSEITNHLTGITVYSTCNYSPIDILHGNITLCETNYNNEYIETQYFSNYSNYGGTWCPSKVGEIYIVKQEIGGQFFLRGTEFEYYQNTGYLKKKIADPGKQKSVVEEFEYTPFGNLKSITTSAQDVDSRTANFQYDSKGRFVEKAIDPLGFTTLSKFDHKTGNILFTYDVNNLKTEYKYDGFGRLNETKLPNGKRVINTMGWCDGSNPDFSRFFILSMFEDILNSEIKTYYDDLGREIRTENFDYDGSVLFSDKYYNSNGQLVVTTEPYKINSQFLFVGYEYYNDGRIKNTSKLFDGNVISTTNYSYSGSSITSTNVNTSQFSTKTYDAVGRLTSVTDNIGTINYNYYTLNNGLKTIVTTLSGEVIIETDEYARQKLLSDPDAGTIEYEYNSFGELIYQKDAKGKEFEMTYDKLGRLKTKEGYEGLTYYFYDTKPFGKGMISSIINYNGIETEYFYDNFGRVQSISETIDSEAFTTSFEYDIFGKITKITYPTGFSVKQHYNNKGYLTKISRFDNNQNIWELQSLDTRNITYVLGNNLQLTKTTDNYGLPYQTYSNNNLINREYSFNPQNGNLNFRKDNYLNYEEVFNYDIINRLTESSTTGVGIINVDYNPNGNIEFKTDVGDYIYDAPQPHAVSAVVNTDLILNDYTIDYYSFNKIKFITDDICNVSLDFIYGTSNQRIKTVYKENNVAKTTKYFSSNYEKVINNQTNETRELFYIFAPDGICAVFEKTDTEENMYYITTDYLGSIAEITDESGNMLQRIQYNPWGKRTIAYSVPAFTDFILDRGFTGHEHLNMFQLINMNGRMYDYDLGVMLSPDNHVSNLSYSQDFNRYTYARNNPMVYTDPDGNNPLYIAMGIFMLGSVLDRWLNPGDYNYTNMWHAAKGGVQAGMNAYNQIQSVTSLTIYQDDNFSLSVGLSMVGFGFNTNIGVNIGEFSIGMGGGVNSVINPEIAAATESYSFELVPQLAGGVTYSNGNFSLGYYQTYYGGAHAQRVGGVRYSNGDFSARIENDFLGDGHDRWRSNAVELAWRNFVLGTNLYNNDPDGERQSFDPIGRDRMGNLNKKGYGSWISGKVYSSPLWVGYRNGGSVIRAGWSNPMVQDRTQNWVHRNGFFYLPFGHQNFYTDDSQFTRGPHLYGGYYNPYSLW